MMNMKPEAEQDDILFETPNGYVKFMRYCNKLRVLYGNTIVEPTYHEFNKLQRMIRSLNQYVADVRHVNYRRFLIRSKQYHLSWALNSWEIKELYELLSGAKLMFQVKQIFNDSLNSK